MVVTDNIIFAIVLYQRRPCRLGVSPMGIHDIYIEPIEEFQNQLIGLPLLCIIRVLGINRIIVIT